MNDGTYQIDVSLSGGTGRASVSSPTELIVEDGSMTVRIEWSSPYYDLMIVDGERYLPVNADGNSVFEIPVRTLDEPLLTEAETTAMSEPHLIAYEMLFDADSLHVLSPSPVPWLIGAGLVLCAASAAWIAARRIRRAKTKS